MPIEGQDGRAELVHDTNHTSQQIDAESNHPCSEKPGSEKIRTVSSFETDKESIQESTKPIRSSWRPSIFRIGPLTGLLALLFAFLQIFASYAVLKASDKATISTWEYQPTVYLAILVAISNKALAFAAIQGVAVTFWLRALKGTTLRQLHRDWVRKVLEMK